MMSLALVLGLDWDIFTCCAIFPLLVYSYFCVTLCLHFWCCFRTEGALNGVVGPLQGMAQQSAKEHIFYSYTHDNGRAMDRATIVLTVYIHH